VAVGLDTVGFTFPVSEFSLEGARVTIPNYSGDIEPADLSPKVSHRLPSGGFVSFGVGGVAWCEASLPKFATGDNVNALEVSHALSVLAEVHKEALEFCTPTVGTTPDGAQVDGSRFLDSSIKRLDVVRDFQCHSIRALFDALQPLHRRKGLIVRRFLDPEACGAETLRVGTKSSWSCVLYDKHAETGGLASRGHLRFETRLRSAFLTGKTATALAPPLVALEDLTPSTLAALAYDRFTAANFGAVVNDADGFLERLEALGVSDADYTGLIGYLSCVRNGYPVRMSENTLRKYRRLARLVGIDPHHLEDLDVSSRLDWDSGTLATHVGDPRVEDCD